MLEHPGEQWAELPDRLGRPLGYGVSVITPDGLILIGGSNAEGHHADVVRLRYADGKLIHTPLPSLPNPLANMCGAIVDNVIYVAGGIATPDATAASAEFLALDLSRPADARRWETLPTWPGPPRMLAVAGRGTRRST